jgi:hypothetical protein
MKKARKASDTMRADYGGLDWSKAVRGKYFAEYSKAPPEIVVLRSGKAATSKPPRRRKTSRS